MSDDVAYNPDRASEKAAQQSIEEVERTSAEAIKISNEELVEQQIKEALQEAQKKQNAAEFGYMARTQNINFGEDKSEAFDLNFRGSAKNDSRFSFAPNTQNDETRTAASGENNTPVQKMTYGTPVDESEDFNGTTGTSSMNFEDLQKHAEKMKAKRSAENNSTQPEPTNNIGNNSNNGNNGNNGNNNLGATTGEQSQQSPQNEDQGIVATEEMFRARYVYKPFWLSERFKNTWKECMAPFNSAKDPGEMMEELFWGFMIMGPKMAIAFMLHLDDEEIARKKSAQDDKEKYDQQLLLMKGLSPAEFHKYKCDWVFGSEELHKYLEKNAPDLPKDDFGYVDITKCNDSQKLKAREHVEKFIKENPYYKKMIENFTHREFAQDELNREAAGMAPAIFRMRGKPNVLTRNGVPIKEASTQSNNPLPPSPLPPTNGPDMPTPPSGPDRPTPPSGPDRPTPPSGPDRPTPPSGPETTPPGGPGAPTRPKENIGLNYFRPKKKGQNIQGQAGKGHLRNQQPVDITPLAQKVNAITSTLARVTKEMQNNYANNETIQAALNGHPYTQYKQTSYGYASQNKENAA